MTDYAEGGYIDAGGSAHPERPAPFLIPRRLDGVITPRYLGVMTPSRTIKVSVQITVEIDADAWSDNYGCNSVAEIRADAKRHVESIVRQQLDALGVLA